MRGPRGPEDRQDYDLMAASGKWYLTSADGHVYYADRKGSDSLSRVKREAANDMFILGGPRDEGQVARRIYRKADLAPSSWWCRACSRLFSDSTWPSCVACSQ